MWLFRTAFRVWATVTAGLFVLAGFLPRAAADHPGGAGPAPAAPDRLPGLPRFPGDPSDPVG